MACSLKNGLCFSGLEEITVNSKTKNVSGFCSSFGLPQHIKESNSNASPVLTSDFVGKSLTFPEQKGSRDWRVNSSNHLSVNAQASICISRAMRWWEKTLKPNMVEIQTAQQLVDSLVNAGDRLVIIDFYSPGCGGCKALHPKICQLAESNPNAIILKVNYEELKTMCHALHIHVLPFFRFYRGSEGRLCSFSCTNATIKKFKDALAKHGDRCSLGPAKGLDEDELLKLASLGEIQLTSLLPFTKKGNMEDLVTRGMDISGIWNNKTELKEEIPLKL
ncbi:Thioredoxin-like 1-2 [Morus notabilis]|uniref:Thioredoxin-like 1-2 n=1 Tax=Morus notabilis TaxID=981085 RepID=W9QTX4_9ROSA|nr:thioredoxin-like 1-2, chloroplastic [Morus notabilis]EXB54327.1 Thioredoxin-like 1-2 [Morus notabilis]